MILFLFLSTLIMHAGAVPQFEGIPPQSQQELKNWMPAVFENQPSAESLDDAVRFLMKNGKFEYITVDKNSNGSIVFRGRPLRFIQSVKIEGNDTLSTGDIQKLLNLEPGQRFERKRALSLAEKIKNQYRERGFFSTQIEVKFESKEIDQVQIQYRIQENAPCEVTDIQYITDNKILENRLKSRTKNYIGKTLTAESIDSINKKIRAYFINARYLTAEIVNAKTIYSDDRKAATLVFEVQDPYQYVFIYSGEKAETELGIYRILDLSNQERRTIDPAAEAAERIRRYYIANGFPYIEVKTQSTTDTANFEKIIHISINERTKVVLKNIVVEGRISRPPAYYAEKILERSSDTVKLGYYVRQDLETSAQSLITELQNEGYLRAKLLSIKTDSNESKTQVTAYIHLDEGPLTQIQSIAFDGNTHFSAYELRQIMQLDINDPLRLENFEDSMEKLKVFYQNHGFLEMKLLNEGEDVVSYNDKNTLARLLFKIQEGPRIRVKSIVVEGNTFTQEYVVRKELGISVGEYLTPDKIDESVLRLNRLGIFNRVSVHTLEEGTNIAERTVVVSITERDPGLWRIGMGATNERQFTARAFTGLSYNNLWGTARAVSSRFEVRSNLAKINYPESEINGSYLEPFLFNSRTRGRLNLARSERVFDYQDISATTNLTKITISNRFEFLVEKDFGKRNKFTWKVWGLEFRKDFERRGICIDPTVSDPTKANICSDQQVGTIGPVLDLDYRDNPFLPTMGNYTRLTADYSAPQLGSSSQIKFYRLDGQFTHYKRINNSPRWIWANSARAGYAKNLGSPDSGIPTNYAFFLGGNTTLRGFDISSNDERVPANYELPVILGNQLIIPYDSSYNLVKTELRFPITGDHGGVLFYDRGAVYVGGYHFSRSMRDSVGVGYRLNTPVGPVALDIAFKINPIHNEIVTDSQGNAYKVNESDFRIHFSIGTF